MKRISNEQKAKIEEEIRLEQQKARSINEFYKKSNIQLLHDSSTLLEDQLYIVGRDDKINPNRKDINQLMDGIDKTK